MEQVESLLSVITFILKSLNHGQVDDMDIELLKSFSLSHLAIAENLISSTDDENGSNTLLKSSSFALEIEQEFHHFESMDTTQSVTDHIKITEGPIETILNHYGFNNEEIDKDGPKDITEPLSENTEEKDLDFVSSSFVLGHVLDNFSIVFLQNWGIYNKTNENCPRTQKLNTKPLLLS